MHRGVTCTGTAGFWIDWALGGVVKRSCYNLRGAQVCLANSSKDDHPLWNQSKSRVVLCLLRMQVKALSCREEAMLCWCCKVPQGEEEKLIRWMLHDCILNVQFEYPVRKHQYQWKYTDVTIISFPNQITSSLGNVLLPLESQFLLWHCCLHPLSDTTGEQFFSPNSPAGVLVL